MAKLVLSFNGETVREYELDQEVMTIGRKTDNDIHADATAIDYNFFGNDRKPFYVCTWLASKSTPQTAGTSGSSVGGTAGFLFYQNINVCFNCILCSN